MGLFGHAPPVVERWYPRGFWATAGAEEVAVHHHKRCLIFRQLDDQELTKTVRITAKNTFKYKRNCYEIQSGKLTYAIDFII